MCQVAVRRSMAKGPSVRVPTDQLCSGPGLDGLVPPAGRSPSLHRGKEEGLLTLA